MCHSDFRSYKFSWATFRRHAIVPLVLFAMALHHQVKLKRKEKGLQFARSSSEEAVVKLKGCHFIHESMLYFVHFFSSSSFHFVKSFKVSATNIIFKSSARDYEKSVVVVLRRTHISKVSHLGEREMRSQVWIYQSLCAAAALQKMHKMGQKPFVSAGLMDICLVKEGRLSHIDEKGLSSCSIEILIPRKTRIKITNTYNRRSSCDAQKKVYLACKDETE